MEERKPFLEKGRRLERDVVAEAHRDNGEKDEEALSVTPELSIAGTLIPYARDNPKAKYLGYLSCGFGVREALQMVGVTKAALSQWRNDSNFLKLESTIPDIRKQLSQEYTTLEFYRNFRLILEKDYRILQLSLTPDIVLSKNDQEYLLKIRGVYTPQQLAIIEALASAQGKDAQGNEFNWVQWVANNPDFIQLSRTETVTMSKNVGESKDVVDA